MDLFISSSRASSSMGKGTPRRRAALVRQVWDRPASSALASQAKEGTAGRAGERGFGQRSQYDQLCPKSNSSELSQIHLKILLAAKGIGLLFAAKNSKVVNRKLHRILFLMAQSAADLSGQ